MKRSGEADGPATWRQNRRAEILRARKRGQPVKARGSDSRPAAGLPLCNHEECDPPERQEVLRNAPARWHERNSPKSRSERGRRAGRPSACAGLEVVREGRTAGPDEGSEPPFLGDRGNRPSPRAGREAWREWPLARLRAPTREGKRSPVPPSEKSGDFPYRLRVLSHEAFKHSIPHSFGEVNTAI